MVTKFKVGVLVRPTIECISNNTPFTLGRPLDRPDLPYHTTFSINKIYKVVENGGYSDGNHVLVEGSSQFVHEKYFEKVPLHKEIIIDGVEYMLIPK